MCELAVTTAYNFDSLDDLIGCFLELVLYILGDGEHRCGTEGVTRMYTDGVDILDEADRDLVVLGITYYLELELFPSAYRLLYEYLAYKACLKTSLADYLQLIYVIYETAAGTTHGVCGTKDYRVA